MVPVIPDTYSALLGTSAATSIVMLLPRGILNSQSRGVLHEIFSATTAAQLDQLGDCHEGPTTRSNTVKSGRRSTQGSGQGSIWSARADTQGTLKLLAFGSPNLEISLSLGRNFKKIPRRTPSLYRSSIN